MLFALGIPGIGFVNARALAAQFRTIDALLDADAEEIEETPGIGPVLADDDRRDAGRGAHARADRAAARRRAAARGGRPARRAPTGPLAGKTFVITGTLPELIARRGDRGDRGARAAR